MNAKSPARGITRTAKHSTEIKTRGDACFYMRTYHIDDVVGFR